MKSDNLLKQFDGGQLKRFEEDVVWRSFKDLIQDRIELLRDALEKSVITIGEGQESKSMPLTYEGLKKLQGECDGLRFILSIPEIVKNIWDQEKEIKKKKEE